MLGVAPGIRGAATALEVNAHRPQHEASVRWSTYNPDSTLFWPKITHAHQTRSCWTSQGHQTWSAMVQSARNEAPGANLSQERALQASAPPPASLPGVGLAFRASSEPFSRHLRMRINSRIVHVYCKSRGCFCHIALALRMVYTRMWFRRLTISATAHDHDQHF